MRAIRSIAVEEALILEKSLHIKEHKSLNKFEEKKTKTRKNLKEHCKKELNYSKIKTMQLLMQ